jgi:hypothetical protein
VPDHGDRGGADVQCGEAGYVLDPGHRAVRGHGRPSSLSGSPSRSRCRRWGAFALADLLALNLLTLVTEFVGLSLSLGYFGVSRFISVPVAAAFLIAVTVTGSFRGWERAMYVLIAASLSAVPLAVIAWAHHAPAQAAAGAACASGPAAPRARCSRSCSALGRRSAPVP